MEFISFDTSEFYSDGIWTWDNSEKVESSKYVISLEVVFQKICLKLVSQVLRFKLENQVPSKWLTAPFIAKPCLPIRRGPS